MNSEISYRLLAILLAALSALGPFSIDTYLPSFLEIGAKLQASPWEVQQTLTAYMLPFTVMTLWHGAISDAYGRRRMILGAMLLFALASLGCALATSIQMLWLMRALQGVTAGAGLVVGRAVVRDVYQGPEAQRLMAHVAIMFALAPAVAPIVGGWLHTWFGWRSVFLFMGIFALSLFLACRALLPETLAPAARQPLNAPYLLGAYKGVMWSLPFQAACLAVSCNFLGFFIYVTSAPVFLIRHLGVSETGFFWLFGPAMAGMMGGAWLSGRLAGRCSAPKLLLLAYALMGLGVAVDLGVSFLRPPGLPWSVLHLFIYNLGMALSMPTLTLMALDRFPLQRGLAASCQAFLQSGVNTLAAAALVPLLWDSVGHLALGTLAMWGLGGLLSYSIFRFSPRLPQRE